jgi:N,N'-diacetylchitobiose transport system permease protein
MAAWATPQIATAIIWRWLFDAESGVINWALNMLPDWFSSLLFGRSDWTGEPWLNDALTIYMVLIVAVVWASFPFIAVSVLAGLKSISQELYEAARMDGASAWRIFWRITFPLLKPVFAVLVVLSIIWDFKVFTQIYVMTNGGGIAGQNLVLNVYAYQKAFASSQYSLGSAIGVVMLLILLAVTLVYLRLLRRQGEEL